MGIPGHLPATRSKGWQAKLVTEAGVGEAIARADLTAERARAARASYRAADGARAAAPLALELAGQREGA